MKALFGGVATLNILDYEAAFNAANQRVQNFSANQVAQDEDFWHTIQAAYTSSPNIINLNNGGVAPQPLVVQDAVDRYNRFSNEAPAYYMWQIIDAGREPLRQNLAHLAGCSPEELAIVRNTTEALDLVIFGIDLKAGDEVVVAKQDYPNMVNAWKQREKRDGVVLKWIDLDIPSENADALAQTYIHAFTEKTRLVHITHMINWTGQILPVAKIARAARKRGIEVLVDGAHTFAQFEFKVTDLECDYFGTSLHKWLSAPFGTGMLYVRKDKIRNLWALFPNHLRETDDIRKFEGLGTRSMPAEMAIAHALDFHNRIGSARKEARLRYLKNYWTEKALRLPGVQLHTPKHPDFACALALFSIEGKSPNEIQTHLFQKYKLYTVAIEWENISGVRVTPHVYTKITDLDRLLEGIASLVPAANR